MVSILTCPPKNIKDSCVRCVTLIYAIRFCFTCFTNIRQKVQLISVPFEHSVRAVNYSVVVFKSETATTSCTGWHQSYNKKTSVQGTALKVENSLLKPPRNNGADGMFKRN